MASIVALLVALVSMIFTVQMSEKDGLIWSFGLTNVACPEDGYKIQRGVLTNAGRLPITVVEVRPGWSENESKPSDFYWTQVDSKRTFEAHHNMPFELGVGQAVAVQIWTRTKHANSPAIVVTSDGIEQEVATLVHRDGAPQSIENNAFNYLPSCTSHLRGN